LEIFPKESLPKYYDHCKGHGNGGVNYAGIIIKIFARSQQAMLRSIIIVLNG